MIEAKYYNLDWMYEIDGKLYKFERAGKSWNGRGELIQKVEEDISGQAVKITLPPGRDYKFAIGLSNYPIKRIIYPDDFLYAAIIDGFDGVIVFRDYFKELTKFIFNPEVPNEILLKYEHKRWVFYFNKNKIVESEITDFQLPLKIQILSYWNPSYPIIVDYYKSLVEPIFIIDVEPKEEKTLENHYAEVSAFTNRFTFKFNKPFNPSTMNSLTIKVYKNIHEDITEKFSFAYDSDDTISLIYHGEQLEPGTLYSFSFSDKIKGADGAYHRYEEFSFRTFDVFEEYDHYFNEYNKNPLDVYFQAINLKNLIDIDALLKNKKFYDFVYFHTEYNSEYDKYNVNPKEIAIVKNSETLFDLYKKQYLYNYTAYADALGSDEFTKFLIKNIEKNNLFKGTKQQLTFIVSVLGMSNNYFITEVNPDPYFVAHYRINSNLPELMYNNLIKPSSNIVGFKDFYFEIPPIGPNYYDVFEPEQKVKETTSILVLKPSYLDIYYDFYINPKRSCCPNFYSISDVGNVPVEDLTKHYKHGFSKAKYQVNLDYDSFNLWFELLKSPIKKEKSKIYSTSPTKFYYKHEKSLGIGLKFYWEFWKRGIKVYEYETTFNEVSGELKEEGNYEVYLRIENQNWYKRIPIDSLVCFVHQQINFCCKHSENSLNVKTDSKEDNWKGLEINHFLEDYRLPRKTILYEEFERKDEIDTSKWDVNIFDEEIQIKWIKPQDVKVFVNFFKNNKKVNKILLKRYELKIPKIFDKIEVEYIDYNNKKIKSETIWRR